MARESVLSEVPGVAALAVPIVVGLGATTLGGIVDTIVLGPLGAVPLAAAGLAAAASLIVVSTMWGVLSAVAVRAGAATGARQRRRVCEVLRNGLALGRGVGVLAAAAMAALWLALPALGQPPEVVVASPLYWSLMSLALVPLSLSTVFRCTWEAVGRPWLGVGFAALGLGAKVALTPLLVHGAGMGLAGAGLATLLAESLALLAAWGFWRSARSMRRMRLRRRANVREVASCALEGAPLGALNLAETGAMAAMSLVVGTFGTVALAGNQVALSVGGVVYMLPLAISGAVAIRVAQEHGAGRGDASRRVAFAALGLAIPCMGIVGAAMWWGGGAIASAVTDDPEVVAAAAAIFGVFALTQLGDAVQTVMLGALRGLSDTAYPATVSIVAYWTFAVPAGWALATLGGFGPPGVWVGFLLALLASAGLLTRRFLARTTLRGLGAAV